MCVGRIGFASLSPRTAHIPGRRLMLWPVIDVPIGMAILVRRAIHVGKRCKVAVRRRRCCRPFEGVRVVGVRTSLAAPEGAHKKVDEEGKLKEEHQEERHRREYAKGL